MKVVQKAMHCNALITYIETLIKFYFKNQVASKKKKKEIVNKLGKKPRST